MRKPVPPDEMTPSQIVLSFIDRINAHDVDGMCALTEPNHIFTDPLGVSVTGPERVGKAWQSYFIMVPDYWIRVESTLQLGNVVGVFGKAGGTLSVNGRLDPANRWGAPAAWQAVVGDKGIALWQVYADNEPIRRIMSRVAGNANAS